MRTIITMTVLLSLTFIATADEVSKKEARLYVKQLKSMIRGKRAVALGEFIEQMAKLDSPKVVTLIPPAAFGVTSSANYLTAVDGLVALKNEESVRALFEVLEKRKKVDFREQILILEAFGKRSDPLTFPPLVAALESKIPHVKIAAIDGLAERQSRDGVPPLIDLLETLIESENRGRIWFDTRQALIRLTGQDFQTIADWRKFWEAAKDTLDPKKLGKDAAKTQIKVKKVDDPVEFFGQEIFSENLVFVIDVSGSMIMYDDADDYEGESVEIDRRRLKRAKDQLAKALRGLSRGALFNVIAYSDRVTAWKPRLQRATKGNVARALAFIKKLKPFGATHTGDAMKKAFTDIGVDTIVLLSDGAPMRRDQRDAKVLIPKILKEVKNLNAGRRVKIDCFGFEGQGTYPRVIPGAVRPPPLPRPDDIERFIGFLKTLAKESNGRYQAVK